MNKSLKIRRPRIPLLGEYRVIAGIIEGIDLECADSHENGPGAENGRNSRRKYNPGHIPGNADKTPA
jgi:hypothetical protein